MQHRRHQSFHCFIWSNPIAARSSCHVHIGIQGIVQSKREEIIRTTALQDRCSRIGETSITYLLCFIQRLLMRRYISMVYPKTDCNQLYIHHRTATISPYTTMIRQLVDTIHCHGIRKLVAILLLTSDVKLELDSRFDTHHQKYASCSAPDIAIKILVVGKHSLKRLE